MKPLVGMLVNYSQIEFLNEQGTSVKSLALIKASRETGVPLYLFSVQDIDLDNRTIEGTFFDEKVGLWLKKTFAYPDVLYVRGGSPVKLRYKYKEFRDQLRELGAKKVNDGPAFNKWEVINILKGNREIRRYIPKSIIYKDNQDLKQMLDSYSQIYLKACRGRKGQQVMRVNKVDQALYEYSYFRFDKLTKGLVTLKALTEVVEDFFGYRNFILQQAIDLPRLDDCLCDMRAEVQRNGKGELDVLEICVRVSRPGAPVTQHSVSYTFDEFFSNFANYSKEDLLPIKNQIHKFLAMIYSAIERAYGSFGEIGIDFALDQEGRLWFIECNSRPAKVSLIKAASPEVIQRAFSNPLAYAKYLFSKRGD